MECLRPFLLAITSMVTVVHAAPYDPAAVPPAPVAAVTLSNSALTQDTTLYQPWFDAINWSGDLLAFAVNSADGQSGALRWSAAQLLTARDWNERLIVTRRDDTGQAVSLREFGALSSAQQAALGDQAALDYLRGDPEQEGLRFRARRFTDKDGQWVRDILGPIIHADPRMLGAGDAARIAAAANDGMLHVFSAVDGHEQFAYVPGMLYPKLAALIANNATPPSYTVDGGLAIAAVQFNNGSRHTILVGALGAGGQGLYALDVTDTDIADETAALQCVLWEFTDTDDAALGHAHGAPQIAQLNDGRWVVLVGNGYGSSLDDEHTGGSSSALLVIDIESGTLLRRIDTYAGSRESPNGLAAPRGIDIDGDGRTDYVFAGDLQGNLWRFDLRDANSANWRVSLDGAPLYTARDAQGHVQAITSAPGIIAHPRQGVRILFGTGQLLSWDDLDPVSGLQSNALYGVRDRLDATTPDADLTAQYSVIEQSYGNTVRVLTIDAPTALSDPDIWRVDLPAGARVGTDPMLDSGRLLTTVLQPLNGTGDVWLLAIDALSGGAPAQVSFDMNGDGRLDTQDDMPATSEDTAEQSSARIIGRYYGAGIGSTPVSGNLTADRRVTYINRLALGSQSGASGSSDDSDTELDEIDEPLPDPSVEIPPDDDAPQIDTPPNLIDTAPPCGINGCVAETRVNQGRTAWKELLAE